MFLFIAISVPALAEETHEIVLGSEVGVQDRDYYFNYGRVRVFDRAAAVFTLRNGGRFPVYINDISLRGDNVFSGNDNCPRILFRDDRCRIRVVFEPRRLALYSGELNVELTPSEDTTVHLRGRGVFR
jgi:hypothetical protein